MAKLANSKVCMCIVKVLKHTHLLVSAHIYAKQWEKLLAKEIEIQKNKNKKKKMTK